MILVKFWLQISPDESSSASSDRERDPLRPLEDHRRGLAQPAARRDAYDVAAEEMFERTDHHLAPWNLVSGENKSHVPAIAVLETLISRVEQGMTCWGFEVPPPNEPAVASR